jgi:hypothetical protein
VPRLDRGEELLMTDDVSGPDARRRNRFVRTETVMAVFSGSPSSTTSASVTTPTKSSTRTPHPAPELAGWTARGFGLPLYTRNSADFRGLEDLVEVVGV